jgi:cation/acetate symporter
VRPDLDQPRSWLLGISPEGIGAVGMLLAFAVIVVVSLATAAPPREVQDLVAGLRYPRQAQGTGGPSAGRRVFR